MFGDFMKQFGLSFPWDSVDAQGGMLGPNAPEILGNVGSTQMGGSPVAPGAGMAAPGVAAAGPPAAGQGAPQQAPAPMGSDKVRTPNLSPLGPSPLASNQMVPQGTPAAGVGSPFGPQGT